MAFCPICGTQLAFQGQTRCFNCGTIFPALEAASPAASASPAAPDAAPDSAAHDAATPEVGGPAPKPAASTPWQPTQRVPWSGMPAWDHAQPVTQPLWQLPAGMELVVIGHDGDWAQVRGEIGWNGWVDARELVGLDGLPEPAARRQSRSKLKPIIALGVGIVAIFVVGALALSWLLSAGTPVDGRWSGVDDGSTSGQLHVSFDVNGGNRLDNISITFLDANQAFYSWTCSEALLDHPMFFGLQCTADPDTTGSVDLSGNFTNSNHIEGTFELTVPSHEYSGSWTGSPARP